MPLKPRLIVLIVAIPIFAVAIIGGFMERATAGQDTYRHLRIFEDVVSLISRNYVEEIDLDSVMSGALRGLSEGLDSDSSYLAREDVERLESGRPLPAGSLGIEVTRGYYVQIISVADGSPAAEASILPGDYIRAIDGEPTRFMSGIEGERLLRGQPGSSVIVSLIRGNTQEPYDIELIRQRLSNPGVSSRLLPDEIGYIRIGGFNQGISADISSAINVLLADGSKTLILDVRNNATGSFDEGISAARLFLGNGTVMQSSVIISFRNLPISITLIKIFFCMIRNINCTSLPFDCTQCIVIFPVHMLQCIAVHPAVFILHGIYAK